jgi:hypothetical protein
VTGPISLQGALNIKLINTFKPQVGQTFTEGFSATLTLELRQGCSITGHVSKDKATVL